MLFEDGRQPVPEEPDKVLAEEAGGCHQEGGQPYQVLARGEVNPMGPFQGQNRINKEIIQPKYT